MQLSITTLAMGPAATDLLDVTVLESGQLDDAGDRQVAKWFGWLPLCLPELFVTRIRSTGSGVCFNFGRVLTVVTILTTSVLVAQFGSNYAMIGKVTSLIYALGMVLILFAPDTSERGLED